MQGHAATLFVVTFSFIPFFVLLSTDENWTRMSRTPATRPKCTQCTTHCSLHGVARPCFSWSHPIMPLFPCTACHSMAFRPLPACQDNHESKHVGHHTHRCLASFHRQWLPTACIKHGATASAFAPNDHHPPSAQRRQKLHVMLQKHLESARPSSLSTRLSTVQMDGATANHRVERWPAGSLEIP